MRDSNKAYMPSGGRGIVIERPMAITEAKPRAPYYIKNRHSGEIIRTVQDVYVSLLKSWNRDWHNTSTHPSGVRPIGEAPSRGREPHRRKHRYR